MFICTRFVAFLFSILFFSSLLGMKKVRKKIVPVATEVIFIPDLPEKKSCFVKKIFKVFKNSLRFVGDGGCCFMPSFLCSSDEDRFFRLMKFKIKNDSNSLLKVLKKEKIIEGEGVSVVIDLEKSSAYWKKKGDKGRKAARYMADATKYFFHVIAKKYDLKSGNVIGDGYLFIRDYKKGETKSKAVSDAVCAAIEMISRYKNEIKKCGLEGPEGCRAGISAGQFDLFFAPATLGFAPAWTPEVESASVTEAFLLEQSNKKEPLTKLTIAKKVYDLIENHNLKSILEEKKVLLKTEEEDSLVYAATLGDMKKLYYPRKRDTVF